MSDLTCKGCGGSLPPKTRPQGRRLWCSESCRVRGYRVSAGRWVRGEVRVCRYCGSGFEPKQPRQVDCSYECGYKYRDARKPRSVDWANGRRSEREIPCMDCGVLILSRANRQACASCKTKRSQTTNRRKNVKRKGATVGVRYTLSDLGARDGWKCHLCRKSVDRTLPGTHQRGPTVDHLIPLAAGGTDELSNVSLAHRACNVQRRDKGIAQLRLTG